MDGNIAHLHLHTGQELGVVAKNELSFLSFQEEIEIFGLRIGMRICRDHVHGARQWVIIHRNIVLIGAIILRILLLARRDKHHFYIKMVKIGQYGSIVAALPICSYDTDSIGIVLVGLNDGHLASLSEEISLERLSAA